MRTKTDGVRRLPSSHNGVRQPAPRWRGLLSSHKKISPALFALAMLLALTLSACGSGKADATPTMSVDAIYTAAFQTFSAQQATQLALTPPTATPSPTLFPTLPPPTASTTFPFGSPTSAGSGVQGCDSSVYVNDVTVPDGTTMSPGKSFVKTWLVLNNGSCTWTTSYKLSFASGEQMNGASVAVPSSVPAGQQVQLSVNLTAPSTAGDFTGWWRLQNDKGQYFGNAFSVVIKVSGSTTNTPSSSTDTPVPDTNTPIPDTDTPEPSATP